MRQSVEHLPRGDCLSAAMLLTHEALPVLLTLMLQAGTIYGKERNNYRVTDRYGHHIPKGRDPMGFVPDEQRLLDHIMRGYEKAVRPVRNASSPVVIQMGLTLTQVLDMEWIDEFLVWDPPKFNNITKLRIPCHKIWLPDMVLYNNAAEYTDGLMPANAMVEPNGNVFWPVPTKLQSSCKVDVTYFPFDSQLCSLKFGSWTYDGYQVDITNRTSEIDLTNYIVNGEWELLYIRCVRNVVRYACCEEPFPDVTFFIKIRRRTLYYMYNVVFPCVMMSALTLLVFCLPPDSGEKIALGITVLLAFSVFMLAVAENLPETSEFVPLISIYLTIVMFLTSVSVIMTVFVLNLHHRGPHKHPVPSRLKKFFLGTNDSKRRSRYHAGDINGGHMHYMAHNRGLPRNVSLKLTLDNLAHELREELHFENGGTEFENSSNTTFLPQGNAMETVDERNNATSTEQVLANSASTNDGINCTTIPPTHGHSTTNKRTYTRSSGQQPSTRTPSQQPRRSQKPRAPYEDALLSLTKLLEKHEIEEREFGEIQDWRRLAQVVDRILFTFFCLATISSTVAVLVIVPATQDT